MNYEESEYEPDRIVLPEYAGDHDFIIHQDNYKILFICTKCKILLQSYLMYSVLYNNSWEPKEVALIVQNDFISDSHESTDCNERIIKQLLK